MSTLFYVEIEASTGLGKAAEIVIRLKDFAGTCLFHAMPITYGDDGADDDALSLVVRLSMGLNHHIYRSVLADNAALGRAMVAIVRRVVGPRASICARVIDVDNAPQSEVQTDGMRLAYQRPARKVWR